MTEGKGWGMEWETYWQRSWEERRTAADQAWTMLQRHGVAKARHLMTTHGIPLLPPEGRGPPRRADSKRLPTKRELEGAIGYAGKEVEVMEDGRLAVIMDSLPHPIYRPFRTPEERTAAEDRIASLCAASADLSAIRGDVTLHEFRHAPLGTGVPRLPSGQRLTRAAAVLAEAAACLKHRFDQREGDVGENDIEQ